MPQLVNTSQPSPSSSHSHPHSYSQRRAPSDAKLAIDTNPLALSRTTTIYPPPSRSSSLSSTTSSSSSSPTSPTSTASPTRAMSMSWETILHHASNKPCGGTALGSNVKGPCKPIGRTDGVVVCWWCSRWLGTFETWNPPARPPQYANVYDSDEDYADGFFA